MVGKQALGDVTDPFKGRDLRMVKKLVRGGNGEGYPNYDQSVFIDPSPAGTTEELKKWLQTIHDLKECRKLPTKHEMEIEVRKHLDPSAEIEEEETFSRPAKAASSARPVSAEVQSSKSSKADIDPELAGMVDEDFLKSFQNLS